MAFCTGLGKLENNFENYIPFHLKASYVRQFNLKTNDKK